MMTESEWLGGTDPGPMLDFLDGRVSERKLRLFGCACCRRVGHLLTDERSRRAVAAAERHAEGQCGAYELAAARNAARSAVEEWRGTRSCGALRELAVLWARDAARRVAGARPARAAQQAARAAGLERASALEGKARRRVLSAWEGFSALVPAGLIPAAWQAMALPTWKAVEAEQAQTRRARDDGQRAERQHQAGLLRELVGNPFRPARVDPSWLRWEGGTVAKLARAIYDGDRWEDLPILADAVEDAGCTDEEMLAHLRGGGHQRGCWALDALLGNK